MAGWNHTYDDAEHVVEKLKQGASNNDMMTSEVGKRVSCEFKKRGFCGIHKLKLCKG